ncbi:hypothetical protein [uncultured Rothia sp.]|uniref:hypothetical protein n=1 Tax=uncultured Rothia sp. TaxID=316088 RepID=UPI003216C33D
MVEKDQGQQEPTQPPKRNRRKFTGQRIRESSRRITIGSRKAAGILTRSETRALKKRLLWATLAVVLLGALITSVGNYIFVARTPAQAVEKHLGQIERGSYFWAIDRSAYANNSVVFLKNSIYRKSPHRVENFAVESVFETGDSATVHVRVRVDGKDETVALDLVKDHKAGIMNDTWRLAEPEQKLLSLQNSFFVDKISINGSTVRLRESDAQRSETEKKEILTWDVALLPGGFIFDMPQDSYYSMVGGPYEVNLGLTDSEIDPLEFKLRPSERMWSETNQKIDAWVQKCVASRSPVTEGCPGGSETSTEGVKDVHWELKERPVMYLEQDKNAADTWYASKYKPAKFTLTYTKNDKKITENISVDIDATVVSSGSTASIEVKAGEGTKNYASPSAKATDKAK